VRQIRFSSDTLSGTEGVCLKLTQKKNMRFEKRMEFSHLQKEMFFRLLQEHCHTSNFGILTI
jgi:hypothetical protein